MRVPLSWLREYADVPADQTGRDVAEQLIRAGLEVETVETMGGEVAGPLIVGRVLDIEELTEFKKPIRFCRVEVGTGNGHPDTPGERGIICGASNFAVGDLVVVALPGAVLPGGFAIGSRQTYGRTSDGMICSERELDLGDDHDGIMVLPPGTAEVGTPAGPVIGLGEEVLDIAVTPDRGYALSIRGVAREAATAYGVAFADPGLELVDLPGPADAGEPHPSGSQDGQACDLFTLRSITGIDPTRPTPQWMRRRLAAGGMRSVSLAVDITNYVMLETGQPLHAFDLATLRGPVQARRAQPGESLETLDHVVRALDPDDLVIADDSGALGLAGTIGGLTSEISDTSTDVALEAAHFAPEVVARMSRRHKVSTEASRRFERGVDRALAPYASARAAQLLVDLAGGTYVGMTAVEAPHEDVVIEIGADLPQRVGGLPIDEATTVRLLAEVGCSVTAVDGALRVVPPTWRPDLLEPNDLAEEVLRLVGYDAIPSVLPAAPAGRGWTFEQRARRTAGIALAGAGYVEAPSYPFIGEQDLDVLGVGPGDPRSSLVRLANPLSDQQPYLRSTLLPGLIATALRNIGRGATDLSLFESGLVFRGLIRFGRAVPVRPDVSRRPSDDELLALASLLPEQPRHVAVLLVGQREQAGWWGRGRAADWADAVQSAHIVAQSMGASLEVVAAEYAPFHPGRCAALRIAEVPVGHAGELHPRVVEAAGLPARTCAMELDLDAVIASVTGAVAAPRVATMPVAKEDVALIVDSAVPASAVERALREGGGDLVEDVVLFDEYRGEQVGGGKKSLAFTIRMRAADRTLSPEEVTAVREAAVAAAESQVAAVLRG